MLSDPATGGNRLRRVENVSQEISQEASSVRTFLGKELACRTGVFTELTLGLETVNISACDIPVDEVDKVNIGSLNRLVSPVRTS